MAGGGFVLMAWTLAKLRRGNRERAWPHHFAACQFWNGPDAEYFRIVHNATQGMRAAAAARKLGMASDGGITVVL